MAKISDLVQDKYNANKGTERGLRALDESLRELGAGRSILIDRENRIIAGNKTAERAADIGLDDVIVVETDGTKLVAVKRTDLDLENGDGRARKLAYADNRIGELDLEWNAEIVAADVADGLDLSSLWSAGELLAFGVAEDGRTPAADVQMARAAELQEKWQVRPGQVWSVERHTLMCCDCRDVRPDLSYKTLIYDPEWDDAIPVNGEFSNILAFGDGSIVGQIVTMFGSPVWLFAWDCVSSWYTPNRPLRRMKLCVWFGDVSNYKFDGWHYGDVGEQRQVWNTRGEYLYTPDPRGKHLSDIYVNPITKFHAGDNVHSHSKPVDWVTMLIGNCTDGDVYDPFCGSGTSLVACELLGRRCLGVEIEPMYCAVVLERMTEMGLAIHCAIGAK